MSLTSYYKGMSPELKSFVLSEFRKGGVAYVHLWTGYISGLVPKSPPINLYRLPQRFLDTFFIFDLISCMIQQLKFACLFAVFHYGESEANSDQDKCVMTLIGRIESDLAAVRTLVLSGHDVQARSLSRGLSEHLDALALTGIDPTFCADFVAKQDGEEASSMWFRHMAKGRARKKIYRAVDGPLGPDVSEWFKVYRAEEEEMLASAVHPTHIAGFMSVVPHMFDSEREGWGNDRHVSRGSQRTLKFCSLRCVETMVFDARVYGVTTRIRKRLPDHLLDIDLSSLRKSTDCFDLVSIELLKYMSVIDSEDSTDALMVPEN